MTDQGAYKLIIPNKEVREVYKLQIQEWFKNIIMSNTEQLKDFWQAFEKGDSQEVEIYLKHILSNLISCFDTKARDEEKESSYHTLLVGLLVGNDDRHDILIYGIAFCKKKCRISVERI